jgi:hypothetical protein
VARRELALEAAIARLDRFHLLILDDLAYVSKDQAETSVLFELISARYERRSIRWPPWTASSITPRFSRSKSIATAAEPHSTAKPRALGDHKTTRQSKTSMLCRFPTIKHKLRPCRRQSQRTSYTYRDHSFSS